MLPYCVVVSALCNLRQSHNQVESARVANGNVSNGSAVIAPQEEEQTSVKVLGMEMTASCEGGQKWSRPDSPIIPTVTSPSVQLNQPAPVSRVLHKFSVNLKCHFCRKFI